MSIYGNNSRIVRYFVAVGENQERLLRTSSEIKRKL